MSKFKVGDKVRILGKSVYSSLDETRFKIGDTTIIKQYRGEKIGVKDSFGNRLFFLEKDLKLVNKVKYSLLSRVSMASLEREFKPCKDKFSEACILWINEGYSINDTLYLESLVSVAEKLDEIGWLIDNSIIKEDEEEEKFYHVGQDVFNGRFKNRIYAIAGNKAVILAIDGKTHMGSKIVKVYDHNKITQAEFDELCGEATEITVGV